MMINKYLALERMDKKQMTQGECANLMCVSGSYLSEVMNHRRVMPSGQQRELAKILGVSRKRLFPEA